VNNQGKGFAQQYGYFEMTASFPSPGKGLWAGFWLKSQEDYAAWGKTITRTEIDVVEFYGDNGYHATTHLWPAAKLAADATITTRVGHSSFGEKASSHFFEHVKVNGVVQRFHSYGGEVTPEWVIIYFDRKEVCRIAMVEEHKTPLYMLVTLAVQKKDAVLPLDMIVKNVSAYLPEKPYQGQ
jgi:beta-glucanase (GH16 family)